MQSAVEPFSPPEPDDDAQRAAEHRVGHQKPSGTPKNWMAQDEGGTNSETGRGNGQRGQDESLDSHRRLAWSQVAITAFRHTPEPVGTPLTSAPVVG